MMSKEKKELENKQRTLGDKTKVIWEIEEETDWFNLERLW